MARPDSTGRHQFRLRSVLAATTWLALVLAVCVQHQRASTRQREVREQLMSVSFPPLGPMSITPRSSSPGSPFPVGPLPARQSPAKRSPQNGQPGAQPAFLPPGMSPDVLDIEMELAPLPAT